MQVGTSMSLVLKSGGRETAPACFRLDQVSATQTAGSGLLQKRTAP